MTAKNLKKSRGKSGTHATRAARSMASPTKVTAALKPAKLFFQALNNIYVIEEDPIETTDTGLSKDVEQAIKDSRLIIPDAYQDYTQKFPCTGKIISKGEKTKHEEIQLGTRVLFARLGVQRYKINGKSYCNCLEADIHAIIFS